MGLDLLILLAAYSLFQPAVGTYQVIQDGASIIRIDTRRGTMERCTVGESVVCVPIKAAK